MPIKSGFNFDKGTNRKRTQRKLKIGVNFTNILRAAFTSADPNSAKKDSKVKQLFALLGAARINTLMKLTPGKHANGDISRDGNQCLVKKFNVGKKNKFEWKEINLECFFYQIVKIIRAKICYSSSFIWWDMRTKLIKMVCFYSIVAFEYNSYPFIHSMFVYSFPLLFVANASRPKIRHNS